MKFVDEATIVVKAGRGGDGMVSFRRERGVPRGGPNGGDGGDGGDVILRAKPGLTTLLDFKYRSEFSAENGRAGGSGNKTGRRGDSRIVDVPPGTVVRNAETGLVVGDLTEDWQELVVARGGKGGRGNARFATATRQTPRFSERGLPGEEKRLLLQLKVLADVAVVGLPNAGKSTLIARVSSARPKVADYPFTTLVPNLGVVRGPDERSFVMADLPGLIEGAHEGAGLGHRFLRHVERARVLLHMLDAAALEGRDPVSDYQAIRRELALYDERLSKLPEVVALNKMDLPQAQRAAPTVEGALTARGCCCVRISAATGEGIGVLVGRLCEVLDQAARLASPFELRAEEMEREEDEVRPLSVRRVGEGEFEVSGTQVETLVARTNLQSDASVQHLHAQLDRLGVLERLERLGARDGDTVRVADVELDYVMFPHAGGNR